jgi:hypothetical protein
MIRYLVMPALILSGMDPLCMSKAVRTGSRRERRVARHRARAS